MPTQQELDEAVAKERAACAAIAREHGRRIRAAYGSGRVEMSGDHIADAIEARSTMETE